ncbi:MAG: hypothetical protein ACD_7C00500G0003 [uncultured bacterium]|nr:MAG: hypothetical protein ACD_7C00500G0003 [uncultured bacterium]KKP68053.1 MAG: hypothetical protein UR66_C0009G0143 [Candidatus Moranbacteria bacterium GW2011_GWE1_35_17]KKP73010.1 MAG: hypothetical protein UR65_C0009G0014 [Candidatus Moranbacteria bacterium GW2011_GWE2_35_164]KKP81423.1 MAG: hypothetical protein UR82_C0064G0005 [Candidatus Moranbacteria bacterium GW2011_GWF1_35_5]KKP84957.1 MAG: hypothetical protein UR83_C0007G0003 [Candidatus Moranbacteria bacterium GW2011_GWF2_35_54]
MDDIKQFFNNKLLLTLFGSAIAINIFNFLFLFYFIEKLNNLIILHYNVYLGVDLMGESNQVLLIPAVGFFFTAVNLCLAIYFFSKKERMLSHILSLTAFIAQLGISVACGSVILVNYF